MQQTGKVALITGAAFGIGKATALAFARQGVKVMLADIKAEAGKKCAEEITKETGTATRFFRCDVSNYREVETLIRTTVEDLGHVDFAFNNAGIEGVQAETDKCTLENWQRVIDVNLKSVWLCMKYEIPEMLKQGEGVIINCASIAGLVGIAGMPAYVASKHGVLGLTKTAALEYAKKNIRVNAISPGVIATPMIDRFTGGNKEAKAALLASEPVGRAGRPEEIAEAVLWLCSPRSGFVTGQSITVDGGWTAQ
jgi:NAD(P)-dependent dehydrogenase (short-subunit alcohol dehydrogenase family)